MKRFLPVLLALACLPASAEKAIAERGGVLRVGREGISFVPCVFTPSWGSLALGGSWEAADGALDIEIKDGDRTVAKGTARFSCDGGEISAGWDFDILCDYESNGFCIAIDIPCQRYAGGTMTIGENKIALPESLGERPWLGGASADSVKVEGPHGKSWSLKSENAHFTMVQDNREWNGSVFSSRIHIGDKSLKSGEKRSLSFTLSMEGGLELEEPGPCTIAAGKDWIPLKDSLDIVKGSALDFSALNDAPAGKYGRVVARGGRFEFEKLPGVEQRFYGANLCFGANFLDADRAEELCSRLERYGYNALRLHHYEGELCEPADGTTLRADSMAKLDNLLNACIRHGIYLTTDLFVSRRVPWRECGIDRDGFVPMDEFKELVQFHEGAYANYRKFAANLLSHVNPETGRSWAKEPALAFLALVNEGNLGNFGYASMKNRPEVIRLYQGAIPDNCWENGPENCAFTLFLADRETGFMAKMREFIEGDLGCTALLTDMSSWRNPAAYQLCRETFDYVDDHFYVDHPQFVEQPWRLPSKCANANPVRGANAGFEGVARHRILSKPFTVTEFNYSCPGGFRGVGGMLFGAQAALQGYGGIWRFAWSHSRETVLDGGALSYFDGAGDPLQRAAERAAIALYRRGDMKELEKTFAFAIPEEKLRGDFSTGPHVDFGELWFGWYRKIGTVCGGEVPSGDGAVYPEGFRAGAEFFRGKVADEKPGDGQVAFDRDRGMFAVDTPCTAGAFLEEGDVVAGPLRISIEGAPAAVWASSLDGRPLAKSSRILLTHATDVQDSGMVYADRSRKVLLKWGSPPHLMAAGKAAISLETACSAVYALAADGSRTAAVPAAKTGGRLEFTADIARDPHEATYLYEITRQK